MLLKQQKDTIKINDLKKCKTNVNKKQMIYKMLKKNHRRDKYTDNVFKKNII